MLKIYDFRQQFLFDESTTQFIVNQIRKFSFDSVMCIGTPSIFEKLADYSSINRILLDIDPRFVILCTIFLLK